MGITSVLLVTMMGQPRILLAMARDGLLPTSFFAKMHPTFATPYYSTLLTGGLVSLIAGLVPLSVLVELVSIGTLLAFTIVCVGVLVLRKKQPNLARPFRTPFVPVVPILGIICCVALMLSLPSSNWVRLVVWLGIGLSIYYFYGRHNAQKMHGSGAISIPVVSDPSTEESQLHQQLHSSDMNSESSVLIDATQPEVMDHEAALEMQSTHFAHNHDQQDDHTIDSEHYERSYSS